MGLGLPSDDASTLGGDLTGCVSMLVVEDGDLTAGHGKPDEILIIIRLAIWRPAPFHRTEIDGESDGCRIGSVSVWLDADGTIDGEREIRNAGARPFASTK